MLSKYHKQGFTLLETVVTISIFIVVTSIVSAYIIQTYKTNRFANEQNDSIEHARRGIETMVEEAREAGSAENGDYPIAEADAQSLTFYSDIDLDQETEKVRYFLDGTDLKKGVTNPSGFPVVYPSGNESVTVLSKYVRNDTDPMFYYYNSNWPEDTVNNPLATPASPNEVKLINLSLQININPAIAPSPFFLESNVQIRNLKENL